MPIELMGFDILLHRARGAKADTLLRRRTIANLAAAEADLRHFDQMPADFGQSLWKYERGQHVVVGRRGARPADDDRHGQLANPSRLAPVRQIIQRIGAQQKEKLATRMLPR